MAKAQSGGGIAMNKNVKPPVRTGSTSKGTSPGASDYIGQTTAFVKEQVEKRPAYSSGVKLGNEVALNVGAGGPGKGREVHHCGSQGMHGLANPGHSPAARDILSEFGPDKRKG